MVHCSKVVSCRSAVSLADEESERVPVVVAPVPVRKTVPGKIGEFVEDQRGRLVGAQFPIATIATVIPTLDRPGVTVTPTGFWKTATLCQRVLEASGVNRLGVHVYIESILAAGKGCATSTSSMRAAAYALAEAIGELIDHESLAKEMAAIEPSDANVSDGRLVVWDFKRGQRLSPDFSLPHGAYVGGYPLDRWLDTDVVQQQRPRYTGAECTQLDEVFAAIPDVLDRSDRPALATLATISATINNRYFPKPEFPLLHQLCRDQVIEGFWVAHSGVAFGIIAAPQQLERVFKEIACSIGSGYQLFGFCHDATTDGLPFLMGCGSRLQTVTTGDTQEDTL